MVKYNVGGNNIIIKLKIHSYNHFICNILFYFI